MEASKWENSVSTEVNRDNSWPDKIYHPKIYRATEILKMIGGQTNIHEINTILTGSSSTLKSLKNTINIVDVDELVQRITTVQTRNKRNIY